MAAPLLGVALLGGALFGLGSSATPSAAPASYPKSFSPEPAPLNTYTTKSDLTPACPQALAGTPGSDPATKVINTALENDFGPGGTVHYVYQDNPHVNRGTQNFTLQDCVVAYPEGFFTAADFDARGVLVNTAKSNLRGGFQIDGASLGGVVGAEGQIYFSWTAPATVHLGSWVCNFARDIRNTHGGGGSRKVSPACYQVAVHRHTPDHHHHTPDHHHHTPDHHHHTPDHHTPDHPGPDPQADTPIFLGYADTLRGQNFTPSPGWQGGANVTFLGCTAGASDCGTLDSGAIKVENPVGNAPITLAFAKVDIGPCRYEIWNSMIADPTKNLPVPGGGSLVLAQTGLAGPPQPVPCDGRVDVSLRSRTNFDTSEGPFDTLSPPFSNCDDTLVGGAVIELEFTDATKLTIKDAARILNTGGVDVFACSGGTIPEGTQWTAVPSTSIVKTP